MLYRHVTEETSMKTKLLALLFLVGSAAFAGPRVVVGVGVGVAPAYGYCSAGARRSLRCARARLLGPNVYYGPRWVGPRYYGPRYYGPRFYGRGYYGGHWR